MKILLFLFFTSIFLSSCKTYHYKSRFQNEGGVQENSISLEDSYDYFIRLVTKAGVDRTNSLDTTLKNLNQVIEVEYLFIPNTITLTNGGKVIYFSTKGDKYQKRYNLYTDTPINIFDFEAICIGELKNDKIIFTKNKKRFEEENSIDTWQISIQGSTNRILEVHNVMVNENGEFVKLIPLEFSFGKNLDFQHIQEIPEIVFSKKKCKKEFPVFTASEKTIFFNTKGSKQEIFFKFDEQVDGKSNKIFFRKKQVPYIIP